MICHFFPSFFLRLRFLVAATEITYIRHHIPAIRYSSIAEQNFRTILKNQLNDVHAAGTYKNERIISSPQSTVINIEGSSRSVINFCANNYLGMSVSMKKKKLPTQMMMRKFIRFVFV